MNIKSIVLGTSAVLFSLQSFALSRDKSRDIASQRAKTRPPLICSNAAGDGGYTIVVYNNSRASVMQNSIAGALHVANIKCEKNTEKPSGADMIRVALSCSGQGLKGTPTENQKFDIVISTGGFVGITDADLVVDGQQVVDGALCR